MSECINIQSGKKYLVKIIKKNFLSKNGILRLNREIRILKSLNHKNIVWFSELFKEKKKYYVVTELCDGGQLFDKIVNLNNFNEYHAVNIVK